MASQKAPLSLEHEPKTRPQSAQARLVLLVKEDH